MAFESNKDNLTSGNENSIETDLFSERNSVVVIEETKGTQSDNKIIQSNESNYNKSHGVESPFIKSECIDFKSLLEYKTSSFSPIDRDISESRQDLDKTASVPNNTVTTVLITLRSCKSIPIKDDICNVSLLTTSGEDKYQPSTDDSSTVNLGTVGTLRINTSPKNALIDANRKPKNDNPEHELPVSGICKKVLDTLSEIKYVTKEEKDKLITYERKPSNLGRAEEILDLSSDTGHALIDTLEKSDHNDLQNSHFGKLEETLDPSFNVKYVPKDANEKENNGELKCSECEEVVELLNNNATFSLEVHSQTHRVCSETKDMSQKMSYDKNLDYVCSDCNSVITVFNNDIDLSFKHHFSYCQPKGIKTITPEERIQINRKFIDDVFYCLGNRFRLDYSYIGFEGGSLYCKVCKCAIATSEDISNTSDSLRTHLSLLYHKDLVSMLKETEKTLDRLENPSEKCLAGGAQVLLNNSQCGDKNQEVKLTQDKHPMQLSSLHMMSVEDSGSSTRVNDVSSGNVADRCEETLEISHLFKYIPERYQIHREFFSSSQEGIYCSICSCHVQKSEQHLKSHIVNISHKIAFFNKIKENLQNERKKHVKFLIIVDNKLFCSCCKIVVAVIVTSFDSVCKGVVEHLQDSSHSDKIKSLV